MLMHPDPISAANNKGPTANPAPMRAVLANKSRRLTLGELGCSIQFPVYFFP
jgi:hypothetical protein